MVWSQYRDAADSHPHNHQIDYDDNNDIPSNQPLEYEDWKTWHSNDLYNMWFGMKAYLEDSCLQRDILNDSDYDDFCEYVFHFSTKHASKNAS